MYMYVCMCICTCMYVYMYMHMYTTYKILMYMDNLRNCSNGKIVIHDFVVCHTVLNKIS